MHCDFRDSFLESACELPKEIGPKVWKSIRSLSRTPDASGLNFEKLSGKADWLQSIRIDQKYRAILHVDQRITTLLFVGLHQDAYRFAERVPRSSFGSVQSRGPRRSESRDLLDIRPKPAEPSVDLIDFPLIPPVRSTPAMDRSPPRRLVKFSFGMPAGTAKYLPLAQFLVNSDSNKRSLTLGFSQVEQILKAALPPAAKRHRPWWANSTTGHVQASAWLSAGWRVAKVSFPNESVTFEEFEVDSDSDASERR
jgi:hypothetical protein